MSMPKGKRIDRGYATVAEEAGANYRTIAEKMSSQGFQMNHASARNHILRVMKKFAIEFAIARGDNMTDEELDAVARDPNFQSSVCELIQRV